jgi:hypothetical protein
MKGAFMSIALLSVSACGGPAVSVLPGSGSPDLASAPGEAALAAYQQTTHSYTLSASDSSGNSYTLQVDSHPNAGTITFAGDAPAYSTVAALDLKLNGTLGGSVASTVSTSYYLLNPYVPLGKAVNSGSPYGLVTTSTPLPTTFDVGHSGSIYSLTYYHDSTRAVLDGTETASYSVSARDSATLRMCLSFVLSDVTLVGGSDGLVPGQEETDCYSVDASGHADLISVAIMMSGGEILTFT